MTNEKKKAPEHIKSGAVDCAIWTNEAKDKQGKPIEYQTVQVNRSYKDKNGEWQKTDSFRASDIPKVMLVLGKAYEKLALKEAQGEED